MSVVTVQLGQCGNQVGQELFDVMCSDGQEAPGKAYGSACWERFFHRSSRGGKWPVNKHTHKCTSALSARTCSPDTRCRCAELVARAVLVDMEPKVIKLSISRAAKSGRWRYGEASHFSQKQGSGNNWANG